MTKYYQQGDVLIKQISKLPDDAKPLPTKVLQLGEATGHKHQFDGNAAVSVYVDPAFAGQDMSITPDEGKFLVVEAPAELYHEEHNPITIPPGVYQIDIVRTFDYETMEMSRVVD